ncbi:hypothetical protein BC831DRAFT_436387 [Entophlyctis helioformis]|nr:hypothetical protein BC831DRAFT_436387 [Entophlyctis helioformis]
MHTPADEKWYSNVGNNQLTGQVPEFQSNKTLLSLSLQKNQLSGSLPESFGRLKIQNLFLNDNPKLEGTTRFRMTDVTSSCNAQNTGITFTDDYTSKLCKPQYIVSIALACLVALAVIAKLVMVAVGRARARNAKPATESIAMTPL